MRTIKMAAVAAAMTTVALGATGSQAGYSGGAAQKDVTIRAVLKGKNLSFAGPSKVARGAKLTFLAKTDPEKVGPHTLSLVEADLVPEIKSRKDGERCFTQGICGTIAKAHKFDPKEEVVNKPSVDVGRKGWDASFGKKGDTFYTEEVGGSETRKVSAPAGSKLTLFCAVHPEMVKTVSVE